MDENEKRVVWSLDNIAGSSLQEARAEQRRLQEGEWRLKSIGYNLLVAFVISLMIGAVVLFEVLDALRHPRRSLEASRAGQLLNPGPLESIRQYMDVADTLGMDVSDEDMS